MTIEGGCFCGSVRYSIESGKYLVANCHCSMCRKTSAAPFVTWMVVPTHAFRYSRGQPKLLESSSKGSRYFCEECGTPLACVIKSRPDEIDITTGSLDQPDDFVPSVAVHQDSKLAWLNQTEF
ncbi:MAG: GFA family protein [Pseudomonadales bacterium]